MLFDRPLKPLTRPPEPGVKVYSPDEELLIATGRRLETRRRREGGANEEVEETVDEGILGKVC